MFSRLSSANGIVITQTVNDEAANVVIGHADTSTAVSTTNPNLSYPKNIQLIHLVILLILKM